jgi:tetraacyldisaccharide 4'-kinase
MSQVFRAAVSLRSHLYEGGYLHTRQLNHPVISVGNLTTGGTGKTPLVIALAADFLKQGFRPVVLSRGYRRRSRGVVVVSRGNGPEVDWTRAGDEPFLISLRLPEISVVVGRDRFEAGHRAEADGLGDLFILDDGFQHRQLFRDFDIVAIDPDDWTGRERLLPTGHWREPRHALRRAHAACVRENGQTHEFRLPVPTFRFTSKVEGIVRNGTLVTPAAIGDEPVVAFAGIARPERFFDLLRSLGLNVISTTRFRDHHAYEPGELQGLPDGHLITTEKDAVRLGTHAVSALRISANILNFESLRELMVEAIRRKATPPES